MCNNILLVVKISPIDGQKFSILNELTIREDELVSQKHARFRGIPMLFVFLEPPKSQSKYINDCSLIVHPRECSHNIQLYFCRRCPVLKNIKNDLPFNPKIISEKTR